MQRGLVSALPPEATRGRSCLVYDRETQWCEIANSAEAADKAGDARSTCRLIHAQGAFRTTTFPGIKLADGSFA